MAAEPSSFDAEGFARRVETTLRGRFGLGPPVAEPVEYLLTRPGKGLRPHLAYAVAEACGGGAEESIFAVAAAGELLHLASLIHDDMVDGAQMRRGITAVHHAFDPRVAVLAGDYMLGAAYALLSESAGEGTLRRLGPAVHALAEAELLEVRARGQFDDLDLAERIAHGKTGALFGWIAAGTAIECREWMGEAAWHTWGVNLGVLFQIADDLGDRLEIDEGKDIGLDEETQTPTILEAYLRQDPSGDSFHDEVQRMIRGLRHPPGRGPSLLAFVEQIADRAVARLERWRERQESQ